MSILISLSRLNGLPHCQALLSNHFEIRSQGLAWRQLRCRGLTASGNLNRAQAAEAWSRLPHRQAQITRRFKVVLW